MLVTNLLRACILIGVATLAHAQTFKIVHEFDHANGSYAQGSLTFLGDGTLVGMTSHGGAAANYGTIFRLSAAGQETVLHNFSGNDGAYPYLGSLIQDSAGNFYGTTWYGGDLSCEGGEGCGTVFKVDSSGNESVLHNFEAQNDGQFPFSTLVLDPSGNLYGTTSSGFSYGSNGLVFAVNSTTGAESVIYQFGGAPDGSYPESGMVRTPTEIYMEQPRSEDLDLAAGMPVAGRFLLYPAAAVGKKQYFIVFRVEMTVNFRKP